MTAEEKIREWCHEHSYYIDKDNLFVKKLREKFNDIQILYILETIDETCTKCWDSHAGCQCWNDE